MIEDYWVVPGGPQAVVPTGLHERQAIRLAAAFRWVLAMVAEVTPEDHLAIRAYWSEHTSRTGGQAPLVDLESGIGRPLVMAEGTYFCFFADTLGEWGDDWVRVAVAHEVAHAVLCARNDYDHLAEPETDGRTLEEIHAAQERSVEVMLTSWGIDQTRCWGGFVLDP